MNKSESHDVTQNFIKAKTQYNKIIDSINILKDDMLKFEQYIPALTTNIMFNDNAIFEEIQARKMKKCNAILFGVDELPTTHQPRERLEFDVSFAKQLCQRIGIAPDIKTVVRLGVENGSLSRPMRIVFANKTICNEFKRIFKQVNIPELGNVTVKNDLTQRQMGRGKNKKEIEASYDVPY